MSFDKKSKDTSMPLKVKKQITILTAVGLAVTLLFNVFPAKKVEAALGNFEPANNVVGQYSWEDGLNSFTPNYNKRLESDAPSPLGFIYPKGVVLDSVNNRLYLAADSRILVYNANSDGTLVDNYPDYILGQLSFDANVGGVTNANNFSATFLALDPVGQRLFVSDLNGNRVLVFDVASITNGENAVNVLGQPDFTTSFAMTTQNGLNSPSGLAYDTDTKLLYVLDSYRVLVFDVTTVTNGENAVNVLGQTDFTSDVSAATQSNFVYPLGELEMDTTNDRLFVPDYSGNRVLVFNVASITNGENAVNVLGQPDFTNGGESLNNISVVTPYGLAYDNTSSRLFVAQYGPHRVSVFDVASITNGEAAVNVLGQSTFNTASSATTQNGLSQPSGLALNSTNTLLYISELGNSRVVSFDVTSITNGENAVNVLGQSDGPSLGAQSPIFTKAGGYNSPNRWSFHEPKYSALDAVHHRYFVSDKSNNRVLVFNLDSNNQFNDYIADYVLGQDNFYTATVQSADAASLVQPAGIAYDPTTDRLFVAGASNRVLVFDVSTITNGEDAVNVLGQSNFTSEGNTLTQSGLYNPLDISLDVNGQRLFVVDQAYNRVMVFNVASITDGENAVNVLGKPDFTTDTYDTTQAGLSGPFGVEFDSVNNRLFVGDYFNARVLVFDTTSITNGENAVNVLGQPDFTTTDYTVGADKIQNPQGMAYDTGRNFLYVADTDSRRIMVFDVASITNGENAINVLGQEDFDTQTNFGVSQNYVGNVISVEYDTTSKTLYTVGENRIVTFDMSSPVVPSFTKSVTTIEATEGQATPPTFTVVLGSAPTTDVVINVSVDTTTSISVSPSTLTFTSSNWDTPQTVTVTAVEDSNYDIDTGTITLSVADDASDNSYDDLSDQTIAVTAYDNDRAVSSGGGGSSSPPPVTPTTPLTPVLISPPPAPGTETTEPNTPPAEEQLEDQPTVCTVPKYPTTFIKFGGRNNPEEVKLLEQFLNLFLGFDLPVNGIYEQADRQAIIAFQEKYTEDILAPWKLKKGTGYVYTKTLAKIKQLVESRCQ
jgi:DNA-binding beta-propeller fold protein YncE